jgi:hypothetical protein
MVNPRRVGRSSADRFGVLHSTKTSADDRRFPQIFAATTRALSGLNSLTRLSRECFKVLQLFSILLSAPLLSLTVASASTTHTCSWSSSYGSTCSVTMNMVISFTITGCPWNIIVWHWSTHQMILALFSRGRGSSINETFARASAIASNTAAAHRPTKHQAGLSLKFAYSVNCL